MVYVPVLADLSRSHSTMSPPCLQRGQTSGSFGTMRGSLVLMVFFFCVQPLTGHRQYTAWCCLFAPLVCLIRQ